LSTSSEHRFLATQSSGEVSALLELPGAAKVLYVFAHGAGAGMRHAFMQAVADGLAHRDVATFRYNFPYKERGRGGPNPQPVLLKTVRSAVAEAARLMTKRPIPEGPVPEHQEDRFLLRDNLIPVWGIDSNSLVRPEDAGTIVVTGSHGGILGGRPETAIRVDALAAVYHDAGVGKDQAGISRLYGGIHISADDFDGRRIGSQCGLEAWEKANQYFEGTARA